MKTDIISIRDEDSKESKFCNVYWVESYKDMASVLDFGVFADNIEQNIAWLKRMERSARKFFGNRLEVKGEGIDLSKGIEEDTYYLKLNKVKKALEEWGGSTVSYTKGDTVHFYLTDNDFLSMSDIEMTEGADYDSEEEARKGTFTFRIWIPTACRMSHFFTFGDARLDEALRDYMRIIGSISLECSAEPVGKDDDYDFGWNFSVPENKFEGDIRFRITEFHLDRTAGNSFQVETGYFKKDYSESEEEEKEEQGSQQSATSEA